MEHEVITAWAGVGIGVGQLLLIGWGLWQMRVSSQERNRQLDAMEPPNASRAAHRRSVGQNRPGPQPARRSLSRAVTAPRLAPRCWYSLSCKILLLLGKTP